MTEDRVHFTNTNESLLDRQIKEQMRLVFERRFGRKFTETGMVLLSREEQDWVITEAGKEVNRRRGIGK